MKLTKLEKSWILYDVANSAFVLLIAVILLIYFDYLAELGGLASGLGVGALVIFFIFGLVFFRMSVKERAREAAAGI